MKTRNFLSFHHLILLVLWLASAQVEAQFGVDWFTLDGGGGTSSGGAYTLQGTIGQPDAAASSGGAYTLQGGFWGAFTVVESAPTLRILRDGTNVILAWANPSTGFQLQESASLTAPDWTEIIAVPALVGDEKQVSQPIAPAARFYRLRKP